MDGEGVSNLVNDDENPELTREALFGKLAGKAKEAAGSLVGNDDMAREGRLQQAQLDAEAEAEAPRDANLAERANDETSPTQPEDNS